MVRSATGKKHQHQNEDRSGICLSPSIVGSKSQIKTTEMSGLTFSNRNDDGKDINRSHLTVTQGEELPYIRERCDSSIPSSQSDEKLSDLDSLQGDVMTCYANTEFVDDDVQFVDDIDRGKSLMKVEELKNTRQHKYLCHLDDNSLGTDPAIVIDVVALFRQKINL